MMSIEANKALVRRFLEESWQGNQAIYDEVFAPGATIRWLESVEQLRQALNGLQGALSDLTFSINELIGEEGKVVARWTVQGRHTGTHRGILGGAEPTNKQVTNTGISIYQIVNGKIVDDWFETSSS